MNPILLKPTGERTSQVVVLGRPSATSTPPSTTAASRGCSATVLDALADLRAPVRRGAPRGRRQPGRDQPARPRHRQPAPRRRGRRARHRGRRHRPGRRVRRPLRHRRPAARPTCARWSRGLRHQQAPGRPGAAARRHRRAGGAASGVPTLGVLPWLARRRPRRRGLPRPRRPGPPADRPGRRRPLDVAVVRFPRISNFTDLDALAIEPGVSACATSTAPRRSGRPDLVVLPGHQGHRRRPGVAAGPRPRRRRRRQHRAAVLGICGGYQMLGRTIADPAASSRRAGTVDGLGLLDVDTTSRPRQGHPPARRARPARSAGPRLRDPPRPDRRPPRLRDPRRRATWLASRARPPRRPARPGRRAVFGTTSTACSRRTASGPPSCAARRRGLRPAGVQLRRRPHRPVRPRRRRPRGPRRPRRLARLITTRPPTPTSSNHRPPLFTPSCSTSAGRSCGPRRPARPVDTTSRSPTSTAAPHARRPRRRPPPRGGHRHVGDDRGRRAAASRARGRATCSRCRHLVRRGRGQAGPAGHRSAAAAALDHLARVLFVGDRDVDGGAAAAAGCAFARRRRRPASPTPSAGPGRGGRPPRRGAAPWSARSTRGAGAAPDGASSG